MRERDAEAARADRAESERDTAFAERKSAVAQRDRARRERDRAMRAAGVEPPEESPYLAPSGSAPGGLRDRRRRRRARRRSGGRRRGGLGIASVERRRGGRGCVRSGAEPRSADAAAPGAEAAPRRRRARRCRRARSSGSARRPAGRAEPKPLLTPVDSGRPRRLSRTRRAPSAPARWAVRIVVVLLLLAITVVLVMLLGSALCQCRARRGAPRQLPPARATRRRSCSTR